MGATPFAIVLGGTCFQGRSLVARLLRDPRGIVVFVVNRGRPYWGQAVPADWQGSDVCGTVRHVKADRETAGFAGVLAGAVAAWEKEQRKRKRKAAGCGEGDDATAAAAAATLLLGLVDFSAFHPRHILALLPLLRRWCRGGAAPVEKEDRRGLHAGVYVLISSDSVYDSCRHDDDDVLRSMRGAAAAESAAAKPAAKRPRSERSDGAVEETLTVVGRFPTAVERVAAHRRNRYGGNKLRIEDILRRTGGAVRWAALRLADVVGPCDDTGRFWAMYLLCRYFPDRLYLTPRVSATMVSLTYSEDVVRTALTLLERAVQRAREPATPPQAASSDACAAPCEEAGCEWDSSSSSSASSSESTDSSSDTDSSEDPTDAERRAERRMPAYAEPAPTNDAAVEGHAYNLACDEAVSVADLVAAVARSEGVAAPVLRRPADAPRGEPARYGTADFYPSVDCGPVSSRRAKERLGLRPTAVGAVLEAACGFFKAQTDRVAKGVDVPAEEWGRAVKKLPAHAREELRVMMAAEAKADRG
eukprot:Rhum_TRINITY_DN14902_c3_g1::Rhum_TRINITY_DN14902_c3_g1_i1::g.127134::m.127134